MNRLIRLTLLIIGLSAGGCAQRVLTIKSEPSGAIVFLNGEEIGRTPMKYDFVHYGDYDIVLRKDGYETLKTNRKLDLPVMAIPPLDLIGEFAGIKDRREWNFSMEPAAGKQDDPDVLLSRADELKKELRSGQFTRQPTTRPGSAATTGPATQPTTRPGN